MISYLRYLSFGLGYFYKTKVLRKPAPLMGGLVLTERCNLSCTHCHLSNRPDIKDLTKDEAVAALSLLRSRGSKFLAITGGEPMWWNDGGWVLDDLVMKARNMGFELISIYTNGTLPLKSRADVLFVSLDGISKTNNVLRNDSNEIVIKNILETDHPYIAINATINGKNYNEIESLCSLLESLRSVKSIFFYFHTPYYGIDELFIDKGLRNSIIDEIIRLKKQGYPIMNSTACLKGIKAEKWKRPGTLCEVYANEKIFSCCRANGNILACENCGYLGYAELEYIERMNIETIFNTIHYLPKRMNLLRNVQVI
jgi:MoaA/NifB/PqqE/SkfB family radical SAM enzyme